MEITPERKQELEDIYQSFLHNEKILKMKEISMHRGSNCYIHSFKVAKLAIKRALYVYSVSKLCHIASLKPHYFL